MRLLVLLLLKTSYQTTPQTDMIDFWTIGFLDRKSQRIQELSRTGKYKTACSHQQKQMNIHGA